MIKTSELWAKEVINVLDGRKLGMIEDVDINLKRGEINSVIIPGRAGWLGFIGGSQDLEIEWDQIENIGEDVILVRLDNFLELEHHRNKEDNDI